MSLSSRDADSVSERHNFLCWFGFAESESEQQGRPSPRRGRRHRRATALLFALCQPLHRAGRQQARDTLDDRHYDVRVPISLSRLGAWRVRDRQHLGRTDLRESPFY